jgi:FixJ family two-component response regulator
MRGKKMVIKKFALAAASAMLVTTVAFATNARPAYASTKVDCDAVMNEINSGKKAKEVATDLSISTSSVYRCKRHAKEAAKAGTKSSMQAKAGKEAPSSAMSAPSPAMAAPKAAASPK